MLLFFMGDVSAPGTASAWGSLLREQHHHIPTRMGPGSIPPSPAQEALAEPHSPDDFKLSSHFQPKSSSWLIYPLCPCANIVLKVKQLMPLPGVYPLCVYKDDHFPAQLGDKQAELSWDLVALPLVLHPTSQPGPGPCPHIPQDPQSPSLQL